MGTACARRRRVRAILRPAFVIIIVAVSLCLARTTRAPSGGRCDPVSLVENLWGFPSRQHRNRPGVGVFSGVLRVCVCFPSTSGPLFRWTYVCV
uniref:Putative secreted protein n=1 Tax=Anopheles darlingi TaxID=43151 RepID=A0A2M4DKE8_ANODA